MTPRFAKAALAIVLCIFGAGRSVSAVETADERQPRSGDAWVDRQLADIDLYGARYRESFIDEMVRYHNAPRGLMQELVVRRGWKPGDIYYACAIAQLLGQPCRNVATERDNAPAQSWDSIGKRLGLTPASPGFGELKRSIVRSYRHWNRPIVLDAQLRKELPEPASIAPGKGT